jgi:hypothetical protein
VHQLYDPFAATLSYVGHAFPAANERVAALMPLAASLANLPTSTDLLAFEEIKFSPNVMVDALDMTRSLKARRLLHHCIDRPLRKRYAHAMRHSAFPYTHLRSRCRACFFVSLKL